MGGKWDKFRLLMWKNWLLQYRKPIQTAVEILAPVLFSILLVVIRSLVDPEEKPSQIYPPFCPLPIPNLCNETIANSSAGISNGTQYLKRFSLVYSPKGNDALDRSMSVLKFIFNNVTGFDNSKQLEAHFLTSEGNKTFSAIQFDDGLANRNTVPEDIEVNLRFPSELRDFKNLFQRNNWRTNLLYPIYQMAGPRDPAEPTGAVPSYYSEGFLAMQVVMTYILAIVGVKNKIPTSLLELLKELSAIPAVKMQRFPYSSWMEDPLLQALENFVGIIIMLSFVYTCINTVKMITTEKEKQLKEAMKIMGLPNWLHWTAWFVKTFIFLLISIVLIIMLLKISWYPTTNYSVFTRADPSVMLFFLVLYICATITFCFAISVFFSKANTAATVAGLLWFLSYAPYLFLQQQYDHLSLTTKLGASLGSNSAMAYGFQLMLMFEGTGEGIQWSNIFQPNNPDDSLTLGLIMIMLIVDTLIYLLIAIYVEAIFPGEYGVPLPWYFPCTHSFWFGRKKYVDVEIPTTESLQKNEYFEPEPDLKAGIRIINIKKEFKKKAAVRNLNLNMYEDQITVLLGHNGAGKTTTMSMLTGMFPPTSGTALIGNNDIRNNMGGVRASLGLCPQHNILFDDLTVQEHLYFFSRLKGLKKTDLKEEVKRYVELLDLVPKAKAKSSTLSGGMKRKLCVGMALCGRSKFVMLDEPTAGMDPSARRSLWDLLQKQKEGRTILLTTHFMDEADLLGDRIAIMAGGELQCCGSSFFLKKKYGAGYHLIIEKSAECDVDKVTELLSKYIEGIQVEENVGSELSYLLAEHQAEKFEELLGDLEEHSEELGVEGYGISLTTLEEVFMKVGADHGQEESYNNGTVTEANHAEVETKNVWTVVRSAPRSFLEWLKQFVTVTQHKKFDSSPTPETKITMNLEDLQTGAKLIVNQFRAMFMKRLLSISRSWILLFIQVLLPVAFLIVAIIVSRNANVSMALPKLAINLNPYKGPITLIEDNVDSNYTSIYKKVLGSQEVKTVKNITAEMLDLTKNVPSTVRLRYIIGASFQNGLIAITAWFNNNPYHSPPLALGLALNTAYKSYLGSEYNIRFSNYPLPPSADAQMKELLSGRSMGFNLAFNLAFSMAFVSSFYVLFYVKERVCKSKHLQFVSGAKVYAFWLTNLVCDLATFTLTILCIVITLAAFQEDGFKTAVDLARMFLLLFYFAVGIIPMMYFASYLFNVPSTGYTRMTLFSVFTGVAAFLVIQVLATPGLDLEYVADALHWAFLIIPHYSLATGIRDNYMTYSTNKMCHIFVDNCMVNFKNATVDSCWNLACHNPNAPTLKDYCCVRAPDYYKWASPGIGRNLFYSLTLGLTLFSLLILVEYNIFRRIWLKCRKMSGRGPVENPDEDGDVREERHKIHDTPLDTLQRENALVLKDVTKYYKKFIAVNGLCLGVKTHECFGLLGINGAGKTSTFKMMTGDIRISYGDAWVEGYSIKSQMKEVQRLIGYCPQFDALLDDLTAKESLVMFALLRGVPRQDCSVIAKDLANEFDFQRHLRKRVKELSGGNKRKLSTAISLIGDPPVLYLDEPTTGMDPATKRYLWNVICRVRDKGKCVVLTSHSMEECEALCTRLAIMVNGEFKCLGSTQHLKNKFAEGYTLTMKVKKIDGFDTRPIEDFVSENFPKAEIRERYQEMITYYIRDKSVRVSKMFGVLEKAKKQLNIEDYSLGQSSLEQVFLTFTKHQV